MRKLISFLILIGLFATFMVPTAFAAGTSVGVSGATTMRGESVVLDISIIDNAETGFQSGKVTLTYDHDVLELTALENILFQGLTNVANGSANHAGAYPVTGDGVLVRATFKILDTAAAGASIVTASVSGMRDGEGNRMTVADGAGSVIVNVPHVCKPVLVEGKDATCGEAGYEAYYKCECGKMFSDAAGKTEMTSPVVIPATGMHTYGGWTETKEATCDDDGIRTRTCAICSAAETEPIPATGHKWDSGTVTTLAGCETEGVKTYTCTLCGETKTEAVPALGHDYDTGVVTKEPSCTETGVKTYTCRNDKSHTKTETIPAVGHTPSEETVITKQPTCEETGLMTGKCAVCGVELKNEVIPALGHTYKLTAETKPTCTDKGSKTYTCENDPAHTYTEEVEALGHKWGKWTENKETGKHARICSVCKETESAEHSWNSGMVTKPATCGEDGVKTYACKDCGAARTEEIPATGEHDYTDHYECDDKMHWGICACGAKAAEGEKHAYTVNGPVLEKPTTSKEGKQEMLCICGAKTVVTLKKIPAALDDVPKTGDITGEIVLFAVVAIAMASAAVYAIKRRIAK